jgi:FdhD protein
VAVAFTYNRATYAVMMATPSDLEDFAVGFSITEGIIASPQDIEAVDVVPRAEGLELQMTVAGSCDSRLNERRRRLAGASGCGLCGIESLAEAMRPLPQVESTLRLSAQAIGSAMEALAPAQDLNHLTRAVHAAGFWEPGAGLVAVREDVGRHNALDKLAGALARRSYSLARGILLLTSRISVELVQKAAMMGAPVLAAVSAPTALALRLAEDHGMTVIGIARADGFEIFTHPERILEAASADVA